MQSDVSGTDGGNLHRCLEAQVHHGRCDVCATGTRGTVDRCTTPERAEPWVVFGTTDDQAELEGETGKNSTTTVDVTVRAKATGGGTRESTVRTGRRSENTPPNNQTGNEEDINPVLLINSSEEEKRAWLSEVHNPIVRHMGFHRTIMKNLNRKGHI